MKAGEKFGGALDKLILEKNYLSEQICSMDESSLFWKWMSERTFIYNEAKSIPGFKAFKDRITVLFGDKVSGYN